jgi:two-component system, OmpR family, sensor kinase
MISSSQRPGDTNLRRRRPSIRAQVILLNVFTLAAALLALELVTHSLVRRQMVAGVDNHLRLRMRSGPERIPHGESRLDQRHEGDRRGVAQGAASHEPGPANARPRVFDTQGHPIGSDDAIPLDRAGLLQAVKRREVFTTVRTSDGPMRVLSRSIEMPDGRPAVMQAAISLLEVETALQDLRRVQWILAPCVLLLAAIVGLFLARRALRPFAQLSHAADRIGATELSARLPTLGADEFAALAGTINGMLARLEAAFAEQTRLVEQQRRFVADASHELRTPLTVIRGNTSLCKSGSPSVEKYQHSIDEIDRSANLMTGLVEDLLLLARSDSNQLGRDPIEITVREVLETATRSARSPCGDRVQINVEDEMLCLLVNADQVARLFGNLIDNAIRYSPEGAPVILHARHAGPNVRIDVVDSGAGIAPEHLPHLGERFYRVEASRTRRDGEGTGLGLSICQGIAQAHGGSISYHSEPGKGTTVTVELPAA